MFQINGIQSFRFSTNEMCLHNTQRFQRHPGFSLMICEYIQLVFDLRQILQPVIL